MKAIEPDKSPEDTPKVEVLAGLYRALEDVKAGRVSPVEELWEDDLDNLADKSHIENLSPDRHTQAKSYDRRSHQNQMGRKSTRQSDRHPPRQIQRNPRQRSLTHANHTRPSRQPQTQ